MVGSEFQTKTHRVAKYSDQIRIWTFLDIFGPVLQSRYEHRTKKAEIIVLINRAI